MTAENRPGVEQAYLKSNCREICQRGLRLKHSRLRVPALQDRRLYEASLLRHRGRFLGFN